MWVEMIQRTTKLSVTLAALFWPPGGTQRPVQWTGAETVD
jgi:hypothetical protein